MGAEIRPGSGADVAERRRPNVGMPLLPDGLLVLGADRRPPRVRGPVRSGAGSRTLEARWIRPGPVPDSLLTWLGPFDEFVERREDRYFLDPPNAELGVKIKDGVQLDLKAFRGGPGRLVVAGIARGRLELWEKWSFPLHASSLPPAAAPGWLPIQKVRRRRSFRVVSRGVVERPVLDAELPGCSIELSEIGIGDERWWTLGLEATGRPEDLETNLLTTVETLFREPPSDGTRLYVRDSTSYPRWLRARRLADRRRERAAQA